MLECMVNQLEPMLGDCPRNAEVLLDCLKKAGDTGARFAVVSGNPIGGPTTGMLAARPDFQRAELDQIARVAQLAPVPCVFSCSQGLVLIQDGAPRFLSSGDVIVDGNGVTGVASSIAALEQALECFGESGVKRVFVSAQEPFVRDCVTTMERRFQVCAKRLGAWIVFANGVGLGEPTLYAGGSLAIDAAGEIRCKMGLFESGSHIVSSEGPKAIQALPGDMASVRHALTYAIRAYVGQNGFTDVQLGLSGGVDSALVATLAADALGADHVHALMMPTQYTQDLSLTEAERLARHLGIDYAVRPIGALFEGFRGELQGDFADRPWDATEENLQARIRGMLLMAHANKFHRLVLATSNKSESAVGYSTLYGDTAGAFEPIIDLFKTDVWALCRFINEVEGSERIPTSIIDRAPSAELRPGQCDQDSLPDYAVLDTILAAWIEDNRSVSEICAMGYPPALVERIVGLVHRAEFKRRQCPMGPVLSKRGLSDVSTRLPMTTASYWKRH